MMLLVSFFLAFFLSFPFSIKHFSLFIYKAPRLVRKDSNMVQIYREDVVSKIKSLQPNKRMPFLCSASRALGFRILSEDYEKHVKGVRSEVYDIINDQTKTYQDYLTSMALSEDGIAAIGSGNIEGPLHLIQDLSAIRDVDEAPRFKALAYKELSAPIHSLDWSKNHLLVGMTKGMTKLMKVDRDYHQGQIEELSIVGRYEIPVSSSSSSINTHVKSVEFSPTDDSAGRFLTTAISQLQIWDVQQQDYPVQRNTLSDAPLTSASWSPTHPHSLIVCGGQDKGLKIIDVRVPSGGEDIEQQQKQQQVVWCTQNAHDRAVTDVKFNPFIPYWLASAGEDAVVNIWDIRASYHMPVAKIDGHNGIVTSVTWSNIRPENLCTTSSDGMMRCFTISPEQFPTIDTYSRLTNYDYQDTLPIVRQNLGDTDTIWLFDKHREHRSKPPTSSSIWLSQLGFNPDDHQDESGKSRRSTMLLVGAVGLGEWGVHEPGTIYKGENTSNARLSVMQVKASKCRPCTYYSITDGGQFVSHTVRFDVSSHLRSRHRFDPEDKTDLSAEIEDDIYCRRVSEARRKLDILKNAPASDEQEAYQRKEEVEFLEDCLKLRDPITQWTFDSIPGKSSKRVSRRLWTENDLWESAINTFKSDLRYWSYRIPPGYNTVFKFPLDFNEPIIAPHLVEEQRVPKELPPLVRRRDSVESFYAYADATASEVTDHKQIEEIDNTFLEDLYCNVSASTVSPTSGEENNTSRNIALNLKDNNQQLPIKDRRRMSHVPPIYTTSTRADMTKEQHATTNSFTPPQSANATRNTSTSMRTSSTSDALPSINENNPFITITDQHSPALTPHSTNPFEMSEQGSRNSQFGSTNPFEEQPSSVRPASETLSVSPRQSTSSSRYSTDSSINENQRQGLKSPKSKHHHAIHNPFKKFMSRHQTSDIDIDSKQEHQHLQQPVSTDSSGNFINRVSAELMRKSSARRNALHGPF